MIPELKYIYNNNFNPFPEYDELEIPSDNFSESDQDSNEKNSDRPI